MLLMDCILSSCFAAHGSDGSNGSQHSHAPTSARVTIHRQFCPYEILRTQTHRFPCGRSFVSIHQRLSRVSIACLDLIPRLPLVRASASATRNTNYNAST